MPKLVGVGLTDGGRDEERPAADLVAEKPGDDGDDEVVDVQDAVDEQLGRRVGYCVQSSVGTETQDDVMRREGETHFRSRRGPCSYLQCIFVSTSSDPGCSQETHSKIYAIPPGQPLSHVWYA